MPSSFDIVSINKFLQSFFSVVGIRISVFDNEFNLVTEYPVTPPEYCALIRSTALGANGCRKCDICALQTAKQLGRTHVYLCHAGLTEAVAPIKYDGVVMGYVILAHMLKKEDYDAQIKNAIAQAEKYGLDKKEVLPTLKNILAHTSDKIDACVQLLNAVAVYLHVSNLVKWNNEDLAIKIMQFIEQNLTARLDSDALCKAFFISRTKLYQICVDSFGKSLSKLVLFKRVERAKALLKSGKTVTQTAKETGFDNSNYFSKVFKKETGVSPTDFKNND